MVGVRWWILCLGLLWAACRGPGSFQMQVDGRGERDLDYCAVILAPTEVFEGTENSREAMRLWQRQAEFLAAVEFEPTTAEDGRAVWSRLEDSADVEQLTVETSEEGLVLEITIARELLEVHPGTSLGVLVRRGPDWICHLVSEEQIAHLDGEKTMYLRKR